jgi:hypothetical protein
VVKTTVHEVVASKHKRRNGPVRGETEGRIRAKALEVPTQRVDASIACAFASVMYVCEMSKGGTRNV